MEEVLPPQNLEAEASVIGGVLMDYKRLDEVLELINAEDFYDSRHRVIFNCATELYKAGTAVDYLTVTDWLTKKGQLEQAGGSGYVSSTVNSTPTASNILHYAEIIKEKSALRGIIKGSEDSIRMAYRQSNSASEILDSAERNILSVSNRTIRRNYSKLSRVLESTFERMDEIHRNGRSLRGIPTGFGRLDELLSGLNKSDLVVLAARPGMGKTSLALAIARNVAKANHPVAFFSLEMSESQLADRLLSMESNVKLYNILVGNYDAEQEKQLVEGLGRLGDLPIIIDDSPALTALEFRTKARRLYAKEKIELIIVDYLQLMQGTGKGDNRNNEVSEISRQLKVVAKELNIPIIALAQLNRSVEHRDNRIPQLSDLRDSGSIEQDSDIVMFIHRADVDKGTNTNLAEVYIKKHRNGALGTVHLRYDSEHTRFENIDI